MIKKTQCLQKLTIILSCLALSNTCSTHKFQVKAYQASGEPLSDRLVTLDQNEQLSINDGSNDMLQQKLGPLFNDINPNKVPLYFFNFISMKDQTLQVQAIKQLPKLRVAQDGRIYVLDARFEEGSLQKQRELRYVKDPDKQLRPGYYHSLSSLRSDELDYSLSTLHLNKGFYVAQFSFDSRHSFSSIVGNDEQLEEFCDSVHFIESLPKTRSDRRNSIQDTVISWLEHPRHDYEYSLTQTQVGSNNYCIQRWDNNILKYELLLREESASKARPVLNLFTRLALNLFTCLPLDLFTNQPKKLDLFNKNPLQHLKLVLEEIRVGDKRYEFRGTRYMGSGIGNLDFIDRAIHVSLMRLLPEHIYTIDFLHYKRVWENLDLQDAFLSFENDTRFIESLADRIGRSIHDTSLFLSLLQDTPLVDSQFSIVSNPDQEGYSIRCTKNSIRIYELHLKGISDSYNLEYAKPCSFSDLACRLKDLHGLALHSIQFGDEEYIFRTNLVRNRSRSSAELDAYLCCRLYDHFNSIANIEEKWNSFDLRTMMEEFEEQFNRQYIEQ